MCTPVRGNAPFRCSDAMLRRFQGLEGQTQEREQKQRGKKRQGLLQSTPRGASNDTSARVLYGIKKNAENRKGCGFLLLGLDQAKKLLLFGSLVHTILPVSVAHPRQTTARSCVVATGAASFRCTLGCCRNRRSVRRRNSFHSEHSKFQLNYYSPLDTR